jgi:hypothetical protein
MRASPGVRWAVIKMMRRGLGHYQNEGEAGCMRAHNQVAKRHRGVRLMTCRLMALFRSGQGVQRTLRRRVTCSSISLRRPALHRSILRSHA